MALIQRKDSPETLDPISWLEKKSFHVGLLSVQFCCSTTVVIASVISVSTCSSHFYANFAVIPAILILINTAHDALAILGKQTLSRLNFVRSAHCLMFLLGLIVFGLGIQGVHCETVGKEIKKDVERSNMTHNSLCEFIRPGFCGDEFLHSDSSPPIGILASVFVLIGGLTQLFLSPLVLVVARMKYTDIKGDASEQTGESFWSKLKKRQPQSPSGEGLVVLSGPGKSSPIRAKPLRQSSTPLHRLQPVPLATNQQANDRTVSGDRSATHTPPLGLSREETESANKSTSDHTFDTSVQILSRTQRLRRLLSFGKYKGPMKRKQSQSGDQSVENLDSFGEFIAPVYQEHTETLTNVPTSTSIVPQSQPDSKEQKVGKEEKEEERQESRESLAVPVQEQSQQQEVSVKTVGKESPSAAHSSIKTAYLNSAPRGSQRNSADSAEVVLPNQGNQSIKQEVRADWPGDADIKQ